MTTSANAAAEAERAYSPRSPARSRNDRREASAFGGSSEARTAMRAELYSPVGRVGRLHHLDTNPSHPVDPRPGRGARDSARVHRPGRPDRYRREPEAG